MCYSSTRRPICIAARDRSRARKRRLPRDSKQIAAWNGLALSAFVAASREAPARYAETTKRLRQFIVSQLWDGRQLLRAVGNARKLGQAGLEDYAHVARGLLDYAEATGQESDYRLVGQIIRQAWQRFYRQDGWQLQEDPLLQYGARQTVVADGAMPSPSAVLIGTTRQWLLRQEDAALHQQVQRAIARQSQAMQESPFWYASQILLLP